MKVTSKYGFIKMIPDGCIDINNVKIIQVDIVGDKLFVECVEQADWERLRSEINTDNSKDFDEFKEACETELKSDPFSNGYHNGERLIDIRNEDMDWWTIALSKLKNKFILDKMQIIEKGIKDGKIYN